MSVGTSRASLLKLGSVIYGLAVLVMGLRAGEPTELWWWPGAVLILGWVVSPIVGGLFLCRLVQGPWSFAASLTGIAVVAVLGFAEQWYVMFVGPSDAQNALIMFFVPFIQWVGVAVVIGIAVILDRYVLKS